MNISVPIVLRSRLLPISASLALALAACAPLVRGAEPQPTVEAAVATGDPWTGVDLIEPAALAKLLTAANGEKPAVVCVGFPALYQASHIAGAKLAGPASQADGLQALKQALQQLPKAKSVVLYCGCCPWKDCPNVRPAFKAAKELGLENVSVLVIPTNFKKDWSSKNFPVEKAPPKHG